MSEFIWKGWKYITLQDSVWSWFIHSTCQCTWPYHNLELFPWRFLHHRRYVWDTQQIHSSKIRRPLPVCINFIRLPASDSELSLSRYWCYLRVLHVLSISGIPERVWPFLPLLSMITYLVARLPSKTRDFDGGTNYIRRQREDIILPTGQLSQRIVVVSYSRLRWKMDRVCMQAVCKILGKL